MAPGESIADLCRARALRHEEEVRNDLREKLTAIQRAADPLLDNGQEERPFMLPMGDNPYDVWDHILDKVSDPEDISSLWEVCPLFREIVSCKQNYVQTRLPQIIQLILDKRPRFLLEDEEGDEATRNATPSAKTLLNLRLISKICRKSVELLLQPNDIKAPKLYLCLRTSAKVQGIIDDILGNEIIVDTFFPPNLFVYPPDPRNVNIQVPIQERVVFFESIGILIELIGLRVKSFFYRDGREEDCIDTAQGVYDKIREWVLYMPILENLEVSVWYQGVLRLRPLTSEELPAFPHCPQLRSLKNWCRLLNTPYIQRICEANPLVKALSLPRDGYFAEYPAPSKINFAMPNLECLHTPLYHDFLHRLEFQLPLKELILQGSFMGGRVSSSELFEVLHQFRDSLEHLELHVPVEDTGEYFLDLPKLKYFMWQHNETFQDLQFLLYAERLEEIEMVVSQNTRNAETFFDRFLNRVTKGFGRMDLLKVFPRLKRFVAQFSMIDEAWQICRE